MKNKPLIGTIGAIIIILIGYFTINHSSQSKTIRIGAIYPLTGGLATYGEPSQKTAQLAMNEINAAGGINGKKLEIVFQDHKCDPKTAVAALQQLIGQGIKVFTSAACTGTIFSMEPVLQSNDAILLGTTITGAKITGSSPNVFRNWGSDADESKLFAELIKKQGYKKVAAIHEETDYAKGLVLGMQSDLQGSGVSVAVESFSTGATDVRTQLTKLKAANPDVVFISPQTVTSGEIILSQMEELNFKPAHILVNDNIIKAAQLVSKHASLLEGALGGDYVVASSEKFTELLAKYANAYGEDCPQTNICAAVYDTVYTLADAVRAKGYDAEAVQSYLHSVDYSGVSGEVSFDDKNDRKGTSYSLFEVKNGASVAYQK